MAIPQLQTCCFCNSLKTGTKGIGWLNLVLSTCMVVITAVSLTGLYYIEGHPTPDTEKLLPELPALKTVLAFQIGVYVLGTCLAFVLLLGVYQNNAKLVYLWVLVALVLTLLEQVLNLADLVYSPNFDNLLSLACFILDIYFILVGYSFYREIKNLSSYA